MPVNFIDFLNVINISILFLSIIIHLFFNNVKILKLSFTTINKKYKCLESFIRTTSNKKKTNAAYEL